MDELFAVVGGVLTFALIVFIVVVALIVWAVRKAMAKAKTIGKAPEYQHIDTDGQISEEHVISILKRYTHRYGVGELARSGISELEAVDRKRDSFYAALDAKFKPETISWDRFAVGADSALSAIVKSTAQLANGIQAFDSDEYRRLERMAKASEPEQQGGFDATMAER